MMCVKVYVFMKKSPKLDTKMTNKTVGKSTKQEKRDFENFNKMSFP